MLRSKRIMWVTTMGCLSTLILSSSVLVGLLSTNMYVNIHPVQKALAQGECMVEGCPGQEEVCNDGLDNDADSSVDEDCHTNQPTSSSPCPALPNDGRPQPSKGANADPDTWKVVPMRDDPSLFKVVDSAGINVAVQFHSKANADQYVAHFVCIILAAKSASMPVENASMPVELPPPPPTVPPICPYPNTAEAIEAGCVVDWKGLPCPFPGRVEAFEGGCNPNISDRPPRPGGTIYCTRGVTCYGTDGNDFIQGTPLGDTIESFTGDDTIDGNGGDDAIHSSGGSDTVYGEDGADTIDAGSEGDKVYSGYGADVIYGGAGSDELWGEEGNDKIYHSTSAGGSAPDDAIDTIYCGEGDDSIWYSDEPAFDYTSPTESGQYDDTTMDACEVINGNRIR